MSLFVLIFLLLLIVPDIYIWWAFVRPVESLWANIVWWLPTAAALVAVTIWLNGFYAEWMVRFFFVVLVAVALPKFLFMLFALTGSAAGVWIPAARRVLCAAGVAAAAVTVVCAVYGLTRGINRLEVREAEVWSPRLPDEFDGYRIVHVSDIHTGTFGRSDAFLRRLTESVNALAADAVMFTGDIVNTSPAELELHTGVLSQLASRDGVWAVLGNHDLCRYARYDTADGADEACRRVVEAERAMGWRVLLDEHGEIVRGDARIAVAGVENVSEPPFPSRGDLRRAVAGIADNTYTILLSHDPWHWRAEVLPETDVDLTLSGHTHAMQFELFGWSPSSWSYPEWGGVYREGDRTLCVSKGAGGTAPFRFGAWPEITLIVLRKCR